MATPIRQFVGVVMALGGLGACDAPPRGSPPIDTGPCVVDDDGTATQALVALFPPGIELFLDADAGGPLRCRPSVEACPGFDACVGDAIALPIEVAATIPIGIRTVGSTGISPSFSVEIAAGSDPAFVLLQPVTTNGGTEDGDETFVFVGVTPPTAGVISADVAFFLSANQVANAPDDGQPVIITISVEGIAP